MKCEIVTFVSNIESTMDDEKKMTNTNSKEILMKKWLNFIAINKIAYSHHLLCHI